MATIGFFKGSESLHRKATLRTTPMCGACGLYKHCKNPKIPVQGKGEKGILIVGEFPRTEADVKGVHFASETKESLVKALNRYGVDFSKDCYHYSALICHPAKNEIKNDEWIDHCRPNLVNTIQEIRPKVIIPLGSLAIRSLIGHAWKEDNLGGSARWAGYQIPSRKLNAWICPTYHPIDIRDSKKREPTKQLLFERHLQSAVSFSRRPWGKVAPEDDKKRVKIFLNGDDAVKSIEHINRQSGLVAFDYETNMMKPDHPDSKIVCCSMAWKGDNEESIISYFWNRETRKATKKVLINPNLHKIASNIKFEHRWTLRMLGVDVFPWKWDTMNAAHVIDNRQGITSIKFQAFVCRGSESYSDHISPYLKGTKEGGYAKNQIHKVELDSLLLYCGLDSLEELEVAILQMEQLGCH